MKARKTASLVGTYQSSRERVVAMVNVSSVETLTNTDRMKPEFVTDVRDPAHSRTCTFCTGLPPHVALDLLEGHGYKLVGTNVVERTCIWPLHKPAEAEKRA